MHRILHKTPQILYTSDSIILKVKFLNILLTWQNPLISAASVRRWQMLVLITHWVDHFLIMFLLLLASSFQLSACPISRLRIFLISIACYMSDRPFPYYPTIWIPLLQFLQSVLVNCKITGKKFYFERLLMWLSGVILCSALEAIWLSACFVQTDNVYCWWPTLPNYNRHIKY